MKTEDRYRFTIQFKADTEMNILVGDALEVLGNRKSSLIVAAVAAYLETHPQQGYSPGKTEPAALLTKNDVRKLIVAILNDMDIYKDAVPVTQDIEHSMPQESNNEVPRELDSEFAPDADIDRMLENLSIFK